MSRIIFTSRFIRNAPSHAGNLLKYMAIRKGVEPLHGIDSTRPATVNQRKLIDEITRAVPEVKDNFEYEDYIETPSIGNASEFISSAFENNPSLWNNVRNYVDYIARRPRAERSVIAGHGLWNGSDEKIVLSHVADEVANHKGNIWTHVVSLRREDAARLGYDNANVWRELVRGKVQVIADSMKIPMDQFKWYGAFHNEAHHPHIHLLVYSQDPKCGYLTEPNIENMRSAFGTTIFQHDLLHIYEQKDIQRAQLNDYADRRMRVLVAEIQGGTFSNPAIAELFTTFHQRLRHTSGKKQYGYLKPELKQMVNDIVQQLSDDPRIAEMYGHWCELNAEIRRTYTGIIPDPPPLVDEKTFKIIKNMVIQYAVQMDDAPPVPEQSFDEPDATAGPEYTPEFEDSTEAEPKITDDAARSDMYIIPPIVSNSPPPTIGIAALFFHLSRMIEADYYDKRKNYELLIDRKLMQKIQRKKQDIGLKME